LERIPLACVITSRVKEMKEHSALLALADLQNMEARRVADEQARRSAEAQARHLAALEAARREREEAERVASEQAEALARAQAQAEALAREEQARLREAEMRARLEHDEALRREQVRLSAQMRMAERAAAPRWPYAVVSSLVAIVAVAATIAWRGAADADRQAELAERDRQHQDAQLAAITAKLDELEDEHERLERERADLVAQLAVAKTAAEREELQKKQAELDAKIAANDGARGKKPAPKKPATKPAKPKDDGDTTTKPPRPPIVIDDTSDPLAGLGGP
jgi:fused signal recognition particle receptor